MTKGNWFRFASVLLLVLAIAACGGLPKEQRKRFEKMPARFETLQKALTAELAKYNDFVKSANGRDFQVYAERENWAGKFSEAQSELDRVKGEYEKTLKPMRKRNDSKEELPFITQLNRLDRALAQVNDLTNYSFKRIAFLEDAKKNCDDWFRKAESQHTESERAVAELAEFVAKSRADYPAKADRIDGLFAPLRKKLDDSATALSKAKVELGKHESDEFTDYAMLGDSILIVDKMHSELQKETKALHSKLGELYQSYTKILADMRIEYYVVIGRLSWDEDSDWPTEHEYRYSPRQVDEDTFEYFMKVPSEDTAAERGWFGGFSVKIDENQWAKLKLEPKEEWPSSWDDMADYWVDDVYPKTYHKYIVIQNGQKTETDWVEVDDEDFEELEDNLGMEIISKPYGEFEDEKSEVATPPGMSMVGNSQYGEWKKDSATGHSFWHYYGQYAFLNSLISGPGYRQDEWNRWNSSYRRREDYYGGGSGAPVYGTYGSTTRTHSRYAGSHYARSGGFRSADSSVRGAGPSRRAGGPGGGGK